MTDTRLNALFTRMMAISERMEFSNNVHELRVKCDDLMETMVEIDSIMGKESSLKPFISDLEKRIASLIPFYS